MNFDWIKDQIDIVELISRDEELKKVGKNFVGAHSLAHESEGKQCLSVSHEKQAFYCFHCDAGGDIFSYIMQRDNCSFFDALQHLCHTYHIDPPELTPEQRKKIQDDHETRKRVRALMKTCFQFYHDTMTEQHREYFRSRGVSDETIDDQLLGYAPDSGRALVEHIGRQLMNGLGKSDQREAKRLMLETGLFFDANGESDKIKDRYRNRYVIPYWRGDETVFSIGRAISPEEEEKYGKYVKHLTHASYPYVSELGVEHIIWGVDTVRSAKEIIITEGIIDAILADQAGFAVLSPATTQFSNQNIDDLIRLTKNAETVYLINDNDENEAGLKGALKTAEALFKVNGKDIRLVNLPRPEGVKSFDLADFLNVPDDQRKKRVGDLRDLMASADDFITLKIKGASQIEQPRAKIKAANEILDNLKAVDPFMRDMYLDAMSKSGLGKLSTLREQLKTGNNSEGEKTAIQLADELLQEQYTKNGEITLVYQNSSWYEWTGTKYEERTKDEFETEIIRKVRMESSAGMDMSQFLVTAIRLACQPVTIVPNAVQAPFWRSKQKHVENLISVENGILDLDRLFAGELNPLIPHSPDLFVLSSQPYVFDPSAQCPMWLRFLDESLLDVDSQKVLQEFFGLCLTHDQRFHKFLFLQGKSRTGKGVTFTILQELVGKENVSNVALRDFGNPFGIQPMLGKKLNINAEVPELDRVAEDVIKEYTGGETVINYNRKGLLPIITSQRARLAFSSNNYPNFRDRTEGLWNRMLLIQFNEVVEVEDVTLIEKIIGELSGVFNWACTGYLRLIKQGGFTESLRIKEEVENYKEEAIPVHQFVKAYMVNQERASVHFKTIYKYYSIWSRCEGRGTQGSVTFGRDLAAYMRAQGIEPCRNRWGMALSGVCFDEGTGNNDGAKELIITRAKSLAILREDHLLNEEEDEKYDKINTEIF